MALENNYQLLSKDERLCLFLRAVSRGDDKEARTVIEASPRVDQKVIDFSADLRALMMTTLIHCLAQANLVVIIDDLWDDQHNDKSFLAARLYATHFVVSDRAWRLICEEYGTDFDQLLTMWGDFMYVNYGPRFDWIKNLELSVAEYEVGPNKRLKLTLPTVEKEMGDFRNTIKYLRDLLGR